MGLWWGQTGVVPVVAQQLEVEWAAAASAQIQVILMG